MQAERLKSGAYEIVLGAVVARLQSLASRPAEVGCAVSC
jgi:hypothetical protein